MQQDTPLRGMSIAALIVLAGLSCGVPNRGPSDDNRRATSQGAHHHSSALISGTFADFNLLRGKSASFWQDAFAKMAAVGFDHILLYNTVMKHKDKAKYSAYFQAQDPFFESLMSDAKIATVLDLAKQHQIKVWFGLGRNVNSRYLWSSASELDESFQTADKVFDLLWSKFKAKYAAIIDGFYFQPEHDNGWSIAQSELYGTLAGRVSARIRNVSGKKTAIAPFFLTNRSDPQAFAALLVRLLKKARVDVVALQDGVGADALWQLPKPTTPWVAKAYFLALKSKMLAEQIDAELWNDLETFEKNYFYEYCKPNCKRLLPATFARIKEQLQVLTPVVKKVTSFAFIHYQLGQSDYDEYLAHYQSVNPTAPLSPPTPPPSTPPPTSLVPKQTFDDVPAGYWAHLAIEKLHSKGLTGGCGGNNFCPEAPVRREQMAKFLLQAKYGPAYSPPAAHGTVFSDVPTSHPAARWIEDLAAKGITAGCGGGKFCPDRIVSRAQVAIFLTRTHEGPTFSPPPIVGATFSDVPATYWAARHIEYLVEREVLAGCGGGKFCPNDALTRAQLAVCFDRLFL